MGHGNLTTPLFAVDCHPI